MSPIKKDNSMSTIKQTRSLQNKKANNSNKTIHKKGTIEVHEPHQKPKLNLGTPEG